MPLTTFQGDLLLDIYQQCLVVIATHSQWTANQHANGIAGNEAKRRAERESAKSAYQKAVRDLCTMHGEALAEGIDEDRLEAITNAHLPKDITIVNGEVQL